METPWQYLRRYFAGAHGESEDVEPHSLSGKTIQPCDGRWSLPTQESAM